jgi:outer membrane lipoprotein SlyB
VEEDKREPNSDETSVGASVSKWEAGRKPMLDRTSEGDDVGALVGDEVGVLEGNVVGALEGDDLGALEGEKVGTLDGDVVGALEGDKVGIPEGALVGALEGPDLGALEGDDVGALEGAEVIDVCGGAPGTPHRTVPRGEFRPRRGGQSIWNAWRL